MFDPPQATLARLGRLAGIQSSARVKLAVGGKWGSGVEVRLPPRLCANGGGRAAELTGHYAGRARAPTEVLITYLTLPKSNRSTSRHRYRLNGSYPGTDRVITITNLPEIEMHCRAIIVEDMRLPFWNQRFGAIGWAWLIRCLVRIFGTVTLMFLIAAISACAQSATSDVTEPVYHLIVGTYTGGKSTGIYVYRFDTKTGEATRVSVVPAVNPSYLAVSRNGHRVYAVNELPGDNGSPSRRGSVSAFEFNPLEGRLRFLNSVTSGGNDPCYLSLSPDEKYLLVANYSVAAHPGGSFSAFALLPDGRIDAPMLTVSLDARGPVRGRQDSSHVHSTVFSPDARYLFVQDLAADKLYSYRYSPDTRNDVLRWDERHQTSVKPGSGPRHLVFGLDGRTAYLVNELSATVTVFGYDARGLTQRQVLPLTTPDFKGRVGAAAVHLSPDGRFLYASNRGDANEIVIFSVAPVTGDLAVVGRQPSLGKSPREFSIDPTGHWLIVGNQDSDTAYIFKRNPQTGLLEAKPGAIDIGAPVDFKWIPAF